MTGLGRPPCDLKQQSICDMIGRVQLFDEACSSGFLDHPISPPNTMIPQPPNPGAEDKLTIVRVLNPQKRKSIILYTYLLINICFSLRTCQIHLCPNSVSVAEFLWKIHSA